MRIRFSWIMAGSAAITISLSFSVPAFAQTSDGETPAVEDVCKGIVGAAYGLCTAYCEAMDCDSEERQASDAACDQVFSTYELLTGGALPCEGGFCGDGMLQTDFGEQCDDGNNLDGDGCSAVCQLEEICDDGIDNDGDRLIDREDPDCQCPDDDGDGIPDCAP